MWQPRSREEARTGGLCITLPVVVDVATRLVSHARSRWVVPRTAHIYEVLQSKTFSFLPGGAFSLRELPAGLVASILDQRGNGLGAHHSGLALARGPWTARTLES